MYFQIIEKAIYLSLLRIIRSDKLIKISVTETNTHGFTWRMEYLSKRVLWVTSTEIAPLVIRSTDYRSQ